MGYFVDGTSSVRVLTNISHKDVLQVRVLTNISHKDVLQFFDVLYL